MADHHGFASLNCGDQGSIAARIEGDEDQNTSSEGRKAIGKQGRRPTVSASGLEAEGQVGADRLLEI